jgi:DNA primase
MNYKEKIDIVEVIQKYVNLQKRGKYFVALCPFHRETKPSFYVSPELQIFKCFGCGESGNSIKFVMKKENLSYREALEKLGEWFGFQLKDEEVKEDLKRILNINYAALKFFRSQLDSRVKNYLYERGLNDKTIEKFEIGFSPGGTALRDYLYSIGFNYEDIKESGLLDFQNKDRFQSRIIFPLRDEKGRLVGFMGRIFPPDSQLGPKYLNSPETALFKKGQFLYGLVFAINPIQEKRRVILVEGTIDAILAQENGLEETVAVSGTSLTQDHLRKLKKYTTKIVFAFDNDEGGFRSLLRVNPLAIKAGFETECLIYEGAKDLADWLLNYSINDLKTIDSFSFIIERIDRYFDLTLASEKTRLLNETLNQIRDLNPLKKEEAILKISEKFKISKEILLNYLEKLEPVIFEEKEEIERQVDVDQSLLKYIVLLELLKKEPTESELKELVKEYSENEETKEFKDMFSSFFQENKVDLEKELIYTERMILERLLKKRLEELEKWLGLYPDDSDKILIEIKNISERLRKIHATK